MPSSFLNGQKPIFIHTNPEKEVSIFTVNLGGREREMVSLISGEWLFKHGYGLAGEAILGILLHPTSEGGSFIPDNFRQNLQFVRLLHKFLSQQVLKEPGLTEAAHTQREGYIYIIDRRAVDPQGEVPPEDIFGCFTVNEGKIVPDSYQRNHNHLLLTENGFFLLPTPALDNSLVFELERKCADIEPGSSANVELEERL